VAGHGTGLSAKTAWLFFAACCVVTACYPFEGESGVGPIMTALVVLAVIVALIVGVRRNAPVDTKPWYLMTAAAVGWAAASVTRSALGSTDAVPAADAISIVAYGFMFAAFIRLLRASRVNGEGTTLDALLVATGATFAGWVLLTLPSLPMPRTTYQRVGDVLFPVLDALLLYLSMRLVISSPRGCVSPLMLLGAATVVLVNDVLWALNATEVAETPVVAQIALHMFGFALLGTAALHPSMRRIGRVAASDKPPLGYARLAAMGLVLLIPTAAALWRPPSTPLEWITIGGAAALISVLVFSRTIHAITMNRRYESQFHFQALHDQLTELPNRLWLSERISQQLNDGQSVGLALVDLDYFKYVNDTYGHSFGDDVLIAVSQRLTETLSEATVSRIGGDEFCVLVDPSVVDLDQAASEILAGLHDPIQVGATEIFISASIGLTIGSPSDSTAIDLLREVDTAMYKAKANGRSTAVWFESSMRSHASRRLEMETALRHALDRGELHLHFQPIVNLRDGTWRGVEALARWERPGIGSVPPVEFIPVAEDSGLIVEIGAWVLREAVRQVADWRRRLGVSWLISVNLSPRQLREPGVTSMIADTIKTFDMPNGSLWIELTEGLLIDNDARARETLRAIRATGARVVVDDFGTGYSSLSYLHQFPIDRVKIDRSFVMGLGDDLESSAIIRAVLGVANALGMEAVAEGVETDEQRRRLLELGCGNAQGYLFARPMDPASLEAAHLASLEGGRIESRSTAL